jgi:uncharacterized protein
MPELTRLEAIRLLELNNVPLNVIEHCLTVSDFAKEVGQRIKEKGHEVDIDFVDTAAILHDIGRAKTHSIDHGIVGAAILKDHPRYARVCESHIGGGISKEDAISIGLPPKDYLPRTIEEKIVCYADKLVHGTERKTMDETIKKFASRLGGDHPTIERMMRLDSEIRGLMGE